MTECWDADPAARPDFDAIAKRLQLLCLVKAPTQPARARTRPQPARARARAEHAPRACSPQLQKVWALSPPSVLGAALPGAPAVPGPARAQRVVLPMPPPRVHATPSARLTSPCDIKRELGYSLVILKESSGISLYF